MKDWFILLCCLEVMSSCSNKTSTCAEDDHIYDSIEAHYGYNDPEKVIVADTTSNLVTVYGSPNDDSAPYTISKSKQGSFDLWELSEDPQKIQTIPVKLHTCPKGLFDKRISSLEKRQLENAAVMQRNATWSAAERALNNLIPIKGSKIIYNFSKIDRQINDANQCLFLGDCEIKNESGEYVEAYINTTVIFGGGDSSDPKNWYCRASIVF